MSIRGTAMANAKQIANWIVRYCWNDLGAPVDAMSLEKLIYYAQCFHLVLHDRPIFPEEVLAWQKGPVVAQVFQQYTGFGWNPIIPDDDGEVALGDSVALFLKEIVSFFGQHTAIQLSRASHLETPWSDARGDTPANRASSNVITQFEMKSYYRRLINEGEAALSRHGLLAVASEPRWASLYVAGICSRSMTAHPLYEAALAKKLSEPVEEPPELPVDFYKPPKKRDFVEFRPGDNIEAIIKRSH